MYTESNFAYMRKQVTTANFCSGKGLVKHMSRLDGEVPEVRNTRKGKAECKAEDEKQVGKENVDVNRCEKTSDDNVKEKLEMEIKEKHILKPVLQQSTSLKIPEQSPMRTKNMSRLEKEKLQTSACGFVNLKNQYKQGAIASGSEGLDKALVKHVSRVEKEKVPGVGHEEVMEKKQNSMNFETSVDGLNQTLKHPFGVEKEKVAVALRSTNKTRHSDVCCKAVERELQDALGGPYVARLGCEEVPFKISFSSSLRIKWIGGSLTVGVVVKPGIRMVVGSDTRVHDGPLLVTFIDENGTEREYVGKKLRVTLDFVFSAVGSRYIADLIFEDLDDLVKHFKKTMAINMPLISHIIKSKMKEIRKSKEDAKLLSVTELLVVALEKGKLVMKKFTDQSSQGEEIWGLVSMGCDEFCKDELTRDYNSFFFRRTLDKENLEDFSEPIYEAMKAANQGTSAVGGEYRECVITIAENEGKTKLLAEMKDPRIIEILNFPRVDLPIQVEDPAESSQHLADMFNVGDEST